MKLKEGKERKVSSAWRIYSEDGRLGVYVIRYANGDMEVIYNGGSTSGGKIPANKSKAWAREVAARHFSHYTIKYLRSRLDDALKEYQAAIEDMPPAGIEVVPSSA